jgi:hypothetical protein
MRDSGTTDSGYVAARASLDPGGATRVAARMNAQPIGTKCRIPVVIESALMELAVVVGKLAKPVTNFVRHSQNVRYLVPSGEPATSRAVGGVGGRAVDCAGDGCAREGDLRIRRPGADRRAAGD